MQYRLHLLGFPHTSTNRSYNACAYTAKIWKFAKMMGSRGHHIIHYGNEGSDVPNIREHVQILSEDERASWFGEHDRQKLYDLLWDTRAPYWSLFNQRTTLELERRVQKGDFILTLAGTCQQPIADAFPGSYSGICTSAWFVEYGIGYYGTFSRYRCYESHGHREWCQGRADNKGEDNDDAVIPNYFDLDDFQPELWTKSRWPQDRYGKYFVFVGRLVDSKGWKIAVEATQELRARLVLVGQGDPGPLPSHVVHYGHATIEERAALFGNAIASFAPTRYREPFGGVAVESQLCGCPCITSDHGAFVETVLPEWRCSSHMEYVRAAQRAWEIEENVELRAKLYGQLRHRAEDRYSLKAVAPMYERYFGRLHARWGDGWYERRPLEAVVVPA